MLDVLAAGIMLISSREEEDPPQEAKKFAVSDVCMNIYY
jgi:hypothetical protein